MADDSFTLDDLTEALRKLREREHTVLLAESDARAMPILDTVPGINARLHPGVPEHTAYLIAPAPDPLILTGPVFEFEADPADDLPEPIRRHIEDMVRSQRIVKITLG